jgi:hypothetical protein
MQKFVTKIVDLMREEKLLSWQGGPIIMFQVVYNFEFLCPIFLAFRLMLFHFG